MEGQTSILFIVGACACVLLLGAMKKRAEWLLNFILRAVTGTLAIFFINVAMQKAGMVSLIGLNPVTVLTPDCWDFLGWQCFMAFIFIKLCKKLPNLYYFKNMTGQTKVLRI